MNAPLADAPVLAAPRSKSEPTFLLRWVKRTFVCWVFFNFFPSPLDTLLFPWAEQIYAFSEKFWLPLVKLSALIFRVEVPPYEMTGSGDGIESWLSLFSVTALALLVGLAWSFERKRTHDALLQDIARDYLRLVMMVTMVGYGYSKLLTQQFPYPNENLLSTYAESSPMGLLWRLMGFSPWYERFAGFAEWLGAALMISRRTTTLGALVTAGVMTNVVLLNFCFDVPVKILSSELLIGALVLAGPDLGRLATLLLKNASVPAIDRSALYLTRGWRAALRIGIFVLLFGMTSYGNLTSDNGAPPPPPPDAPKMPPELIGTYATVGMDPGFPVQRMFRTGQFLRLFWPDKPTTQWKVDKDDGHHFDATCYTPGVPKLSVDWEATDANHLHFTGTFGDAPIDLKMVRIDPRQGLLMTRGFHWVNETPFNR